MFINCLCRIPECCKYSNYNGDNLIYMTAEYRSWYGQQKPRCHRKQHRENKVPVHLPENTDMKNKLAPYKHPGHKSPACHGVCKNFRPGSFPIFFPILLPLLSAPFFLPPYIKNPSVSLFYIHHTARKQFYILLFLLSTWPILLF